MISSIFGELAKIVTGFGTLFTNCVTSVVSTIYTPGVGESGGVLTVFGTLCLIGTGVGLFTWVFKMIKNFIKVR